MKKMMIMMGLCAAIALTSCGRGKPDPSSTGDTTSTSDAVNRANGIDGIKDAKSRKIAGDTTADGQLKKRDTTKLNQQH
jgi:hypothetical protein